MTRIQVLRSSRDAVCTSYISGGAALMRNMPFSWLAMSRTIRFCSDTTEDLSCQANKRIGVSLWTPGPQGTVVSKPLRVLTGLQSLWGTEETRFGAAEE